ncbi:unnamed protein product [Medioppia subpectinata]|uniref:Glycine-rich protein n=1 Tax=Medioppia subpectinata TaxID=1979941 RepID=A0A7R9L314_9ACAR|nr:unnamed protein product [Medioppia subpectinata]CAG2114400.1 unnamed protein product [Medioppia subpectinata]
MFKILVIGLLLAYILNLSTINCAAVRGRQIEVDSSDRQLDIPNENEIPESPGYNPDNNRPSYTPGRRRGSQSEGLLNRIVNFFKDMLGFGDKDSQSGGDGGGIFGGRGGGGGIFGGGGDGGSGDGGNQSGNGILGFIRRAFGGLIDRFLGRFNGRGGEGSVGGEGGFPLIRPQARNEPLRRN